VQRKQLLILFKVILKRELFATLCLQGFSKRYNNNVYYNTIFQRSWRVGLVEPFSPVRFPKDGLYIAEYKHVVLEQAEVLCREWVLG
jgi:hypothetical protein